MKHYRFELALAAVLTGACLLISLWQSPGRPMTQEEVANYLAIIDANLSMPAEEKADFLSRLRAFGGADDGEPIYMLNLMRYYDVLRPASGIPEGFSGSPVEANAFYERKVTPLALKSGSFPLFMGEVHEPNVVAAAPEEDNWDRILVMRYTNRRAVFKLLSDPVYAQYAPYKLASLHVGLVPVEGGLAVPDFRFLSVVAALATFLVAGWVRAARRALD